MRKTCFAALIWCLLIIFSGVVTNAQSVQARTLRGLQGVQVSVLMDDRPSLSQTGNLSKTQLQTIAELRMRREGIRVLTEAQSISTPGMPVLYISVNIMQHQGVKDFYAFSVEVSLEQMVTLERPPSMTFSAETWSKGFFGTSGIDELSKVVREMVGDTLDKFINDYLAANPK